MTGTTDPFNPARPAGAYEDLYARVPQAKSQQEWHPKDGPLPSLFVSHGAPPTLYDPEWLGDLFTWSQSMPQPRAIVVVAIALRAFRCDVVHYSMSNLFDKDCDYPDCDRS